MAQRNTKQTSDITPFLVFVGITLTVMFVVGTNEPLKEFIFGLLPDGVLSSIDPTHILVSIAGTCVLTLLIALCFGNRGADSATPAKTQRTVRNTRTQSTARPARAANTVRTDTMAAKTVQRDSLLRVIRNTEDTDRAWATTYLMLSKFPEYISLTSESGKELARARKKAKRLTELFKNNGGTFSDAALEELKMAADEYAKWLNINKNYATRIGNTRLSTMERDALKKIGLFLNMALDDHNSNKMRNDSLKNILEVIDADIRPRNRAYAAILTAAVEKALLDPTTSAARKPAYA